MAVAYCNGSAHADVQAAARSQCGQRCAAAAACVLLAIPRSCSDSTNSCQTGYCSCCSVMVASLSWALAAAVAAAAASSSIAAASPGCSSSCRPDAIRFCCHSRRCPSPAAAAHQAVVTQIANSSSSEGSSSSHICSICNQGCPAKQVQFSAGQGVEAQVLSRMCCLWGIAVALLLLPLLLLPPVCMPCLCLPSSTSLLQHSQCQLPSCCCCCCCRASTGTTISSSQCSQCCCSHTALTLTHISRHPEHSVCSSPASESPAAAGWGCCHQQNQQHWHQQLYRCCC